MLILQQRGQGAHAKYVTSINFQPNNLESQPASIFSHSIYALIWKPIHLSGKMMGGKRFSFSTEGSDKVYQAKVISQD